MQNQTLMSAISNRYANLEMWSLDPSSEKRGPFVIVQCGTAPGDELTTEQMFLLRHDGKWVNIQCLDPAGTSPWLGEMIFDSPQQCLQLLYKLDGDAEVLEVPSPGKRLPPRITCGPVADPFSKIYCLIAHYQHR